VGVLRSVGVIREIVLVSIDYYGTRSGSIPDVISIPPRRG